MRRIVIAALAILVAGSSLAKDTNVVGKTYTFTIPDDVTFESHQKLEFYTFRWGKPPHFALFMLNVNPAPLTPGTLKPIVDMMEKTFEDQMKKQGQASEIQKTRTELDLGPFKGTEVEFIIQHTDGMTIRQYMFVLHDGNNAWNGQLTAHSPDDIAQARMILKKAKRIANKAIDSEKK